MITQKDMKALELNETRMDKISNWVLILAPIFLLATCMLNLKTATMIGGLEGYQLSDLWQSWIQGVDVSKQYSGIYLMAMERFSTAFSQFRFAIVMAVLVYINQILHKRNMRVLETLRNSGLISD